MNEPAAWTLERDSEGIAWLTLDKPGTSANVLSSGVLRELGALLQPLAQNPPAGVVVLSGKKSGFIAGADIKEFTGIASAEDGYSLIRSGQQVLDQLEALPCPTVAAIHGFALGGGLELALACRYRVAVGDERLSLGLPEVQLGIHPGFGGTVRSVRLVGVRPAMDMMLTGKSVRADKALRIGLVDRLVAGRRAATPPPAISFSAPPPRIVRRSSRRCSAGPWCARSVKPALLAQVARQGAAVNTTPRPLPSWSCGRATARAARRPSKPKPARSLTCSRPTPRATWCGCSSCRIG